MKKDNAYKINRHSKYFLEFIQLVVMGLLFLFVLKRELVVFVKELISSLPVGGNFIESIAVKGYVIFNLISHSPSLIVFTFLILQVMVFATFKCLTLLYCYPFYYAKENLTIVEKKVEHFYRNNRTTYLENLRLLF